MEKPGREVEKTLITSGIFLVTGDVLCSKQADSGAIPFGPDIVASSTELAWTGK